MQFSIQTSKRSKFNSSIENMFIEVNNSTQGIVISSTLVHNSWVVENELVKLNFG